MPSALHPGSAVASSLGAEPLWPRVARQFFTHSGHVPLTLLVLETLLAKPGYFAEPDPYLLLLAGIFQAWVAEAGPFRGSWRIVLANFSGPLLYSLIEAALEGLRFFQGWHHQAYWIFAAGFALLHWLQARRGDIPALLVLAENVWRAAIPLTLYAVFEVQESAGTKSLAAFFDDSAHRFLAIVLLMLGTLLGAADIGLRRSVATIRALNARLHEFSAWSLGHEILNRAIADEGALALQRGQRAVLFMDIRGFTAWSERQSPEAVVGMLNAYYAVAEAAIVGMRPIKLKYTADEVMAVFGSAADACRAGRAMLAAVTEQLHPLGLNAGAGIHLGAVVEGVLGGRDARAYDFIGDTVNTAQRLCDAAAPGELLVSAEACIAAAVSPEIWREIVAKGKREPLRAGVVATQGE